MKTRSEIDDKDKINLKDLFINLDEFNKELLKISKDIKQVSKYQEHLLDNENILYEVLELDKNLSSRLERLYIYAHLSNDFDLSDKTGNEIIGKVLVLYNNYSALTSYIVPELLSKDEKIVKDYLKKNPKLKEYALNLKEIYRTKKHVLSKAEERILAIASDAFRTPDEVMSKLTNADLKFGTIKDEKGNDIEITNSNFSIYLESKNQNIRIEAFKALYKGYAKLNNTLATILASEVRNHNNLSKIRLYKSSLEASLDSNNIDPKIYDNLINAVHQNLPLFYKQWSLRKDILNLKELHIYDTYVPLAQKIDKKYSFEEGRSLVESSLSILGKDYLKVIKEAFDDNWIDVYPNQNKLSGGYCTSSYLAHPYVFLNYENKFSDVTTLAHELGHAMQFYYANKNNPYQNANYSIFVAEVASQVNELLLIKYLMANCHQRDELLFYIDHLLKMFKSTIVRQTMFAEFEKKIHEMDQNNIILTKEVLNDTYNELNKLYYGKDVIIDDEIKYEWSRIPHFYYDFYVYQYSTGFVSALVIANNIYNKKKGALENYLKFLKLGSTKDPVASLKVAGIDITSNEVYNDAFKEFAKLLDDAKKVSKQKE